MRSIDANLHSALAAKTRRPAIGLTLADTINHLSPYQTPGLADMASDVCIANDGSIIRVNLAGVHDAATASFQYTRVTDPAIASQWSNVTTFSGGSGNMHTDGGCAVSNNAGTLRAFAQRLTGGNAILVWTSTTNGASWSGPVSVLTPPVNALTRGIASAGNNDVFFLYDILGGVDMGASFFSAGSWGALQHYGTILANQGNGIAVSWSGSVYYIAFSDSYTLWSYRYTAPGSGGSWLPADNARIAPATSTAVARLSPRLSFYDGRYHLCCNELDNGSISGSVYNYCRVRESSDFVHWSDGWILADVPTIYGGNVFYLAAPQSGSSGARYYFSSPARVLSTPAFSTAHSNQYLDASPGVLSYRRVEYLNRPAELVVVLDNAQGQYNSLLNLAGSSNYQPITPEATVRLSEGYMVGGPPPTTPDTIATGTYHIARVDIERGPQSNQIRIFARDLSSRLDRTARWQNTYYAQTLEWLLREICARASIFQVQIVAGSQLAQTIGTFVLQAGLSYRAVLESLCGTYGLFYFLDESETLQIRDLNSGDPSVWSYQPEVELLSFGGDYQRVNHVIVSGRPPGGDPFNLTTSELCDTNALQATRLENVLHHVDYKLIDIAQTSTVATLLLSEQQRGQTSHRVTVPLNPALQLLDVLDLLDAAAPTGSGQSSTCRIIGQQALYNAQSAEYESQLILAGK